MAYKFFTGNLNTSGSLNVESAITGNAVRVDTGGVVVAAGNIVASTSQLTASAVSASSAQFGSITVPTLSSTNLDLAGYLDVKGPVRLSGTIGLGDGASDVITVNGQITGSLFDINGGTIDGVSINTSDITVGAGKTLNVSAGTLTLAAGQVAADKVGAGTFNAGTFSFNGSTISNLGSVTTADINGGTIDGTSIGASAQSTGQFTTLSASSTLQAGGNATIAGTLAVNGATISGTRLNLGQDGGTISISGSGQAQFGGAGTFAGNLTVNGASTTVQQLTASFSTLGAARVTSLSSSGNVIVAGDLQVNGTTTYINSTNLNVTDKKVVLATGSANAIAANEAGIYIGNDDGSEYASFAYDGNNDSWDLKSVNGLNLSGSAMGIKIDNTTVVQRNALFSGAITGSSAGVGLKLKYATISTTPFSPALSEYVLGVDTSTTAITINLPAPGAGDVGRVLLIKDVSNNASVNNITIAPNGTDQIDGVNASVKLESNSAAVHCIVTAANKWGLF